MPDGDPWLGRITFVLATIAWLVMIWRLWR